jgi:hypothetical protein
VSLAQVAPNVIVNEPAPVGLAATTSSVLFSQPFCEQTGIPRGVYAVGSSTPLITLPSSSCVENYFAIANGMGGFTAGNVYIYGLIGIAPTIFQSTLSGGAATPFINNLQLNNTTPSHVDLAFDTVGTFGFNLIVVGDNGIQGYTAAGTPTFFYPSPAVGFLLESATVAPLSYSLCPGCLFFTAGNGTNSGAIYVIHPGAPSGSNSATLFANGPTEPEGIVFVTANACTNGGASYFVSGFHHPASPGQIISNNGAVLEYTPLQLAPYVGQFLVPDEISGNIYAFSGATSSVFSAPNYQLEASSAAVCPVHGSTTGFMTGGGQMSAFSASHGFNLGCNVGSNHNSLEVNWAGGNNFHLDTISSVTCYLDPTLPSPGQPPAGFNTLVLTGTGKLNNQPGATVSVILTDAGEPGTNDQASIIVVSSGGSTVLNVPFAPLATGNQQAHK